MPLSLLAFVHTNDLGSETRPGGEYRVNLWVREAYVQPLLDSAIKQQRSPAPGLNQLSPNTVKADYGRHSALRLMPQLADADLVCFKVQDLSEMQEILDVLKRA